MSDYLRILTWNVQWARAGTPRGEEIKRQVGETDPDIICITEGFSELLPESGGIIDSDPDYGYRMHEGRRKVLLWSRKGWGEIDRVGHPEMPGGRFVAGSTETQVGVVRALGVCIPWRDAHVRTGRGDREAWEDHRKYLRGLKSVLEPSGRTDDEIVVGDFNQRIPRKRTPKAVFEQLMNTMGDGFSICTAGELADVDALAIDHIAHRGRLSCGAVKVLPKISEEGLRLSDHFGLIVDLQNGLAARGS